MLTAPPVERGIDREQEGEKESKREREREIPKESEEARFSIVVIR